MNDTKKMILEKSFALFLAKGYDGVSISDIQRVTSMGRASLYHYFDSKEGLLRDVFDFFYNDLANQFKIKDYDKMTLSGYLILRRDRVMLWREYMEQNSGYKIEMINFMVFILTVIQYFPDLKNRLILMTEEELLQWKAVIRNSIAKGEIRNDLDISKTARLFMGVDDGVGFVVAISDSFFKPAEYVYDMQMYFLSLLKP